VIEATSLARPPSLPSEVAKRILYATVMAVVVSSIKGADGKDDAMSVVIMVLTSSAVIETHSILVRDAMSMLVTAASVATVL